jgi:tetratricopeptide (TPR) repeat protein
MGKKRPPQLPKQPPAQRTELVSARVQRLVADGARLLAARRPGEAIAKLSEAWDLDPQNVAAAINLGGAYILQGRHDGAIPVLEAASLLEPDNPMVWSNLAAAYLGKLPLATSERQQRAIDAYERALALDARAPHVQYNLGLIYLERDEPLQAASHFQGALAADPSDLDARYWLDRIRQGSGPTDRLVGEN